MRDNQSNNAEVCQNKPISSAIRSGVVRKSIKRTLSTAQFETIVIEDSIEETIEWKNLAERQIKVNNWNKILIEQFKTTHDQVLDELNLPEKKAYFNKISSSTTERYKDKVQPVEKNTLDDLDILDSLK